MHPIYVKDGQEQIAPTPRDEVRLRFNGWQLKPTPRSTESTAGPPGEPPGEDGETAADPPTPRRSRRTPPSTD